jgi:hypothetical protein
VRVKGVPGTPNKVLHPWLQQEIEDALKGLPADSGLPTDSDTWLQWQQILSVRITSAESLPRLRMLLIMDSLSGHLTPSLRRWLLEHGVLPLYTPIGGSWLNLSESMQPSWCSEPWPGRIYACLNRSSSTWSKLHEPGPTIQRHLPGAAGGMCVGNEHGNACIGWPHQEHASFGLCVAHGRPWLNGKRSGE